jgi:hypothetical protein
MLIVVTQTIVEEYLPLKKCNSRISLHFLSVWAILNPHGATPVWVENHRCLRSRLSLQVFYLWRPVLSTAPPFILWWSNLEILFAPYPPANGLLSQYRMHNSDRVRLKHVNLSKFEFAPGHLCWYYSSPTMWSRCSKCLYWMIHMPRITMPKSRWDYWGDIFRIENPSV